MINPYIKSTLYKQMRLLSPKLNWFFGPNMYNGCCEANDVFDSKILVKIPVSLRQKLQ